MKAATTLKTPWHILPPEDLKALGTEARRRSDFEQAGWLHDSTVVDMDDIPNLPDELEFIAYFDEETDPEEMVKCFKDKLAELAGYGLKTAPGEISVDYVADQDWNTVWQKYYHVINLSRHLAIVPEWEDYQPAFKDQEITAWTQAWPLGRATTRPPSWPCWALNGPWSSRLLSLT